jgi:hypothetical protein
MKPVSNESRTNPLKYPRVDFSMGLSSFGFTQLRRDGILSLRPLFVNQVTYAQYAQTRRGIQAMAEWRDAFGGDFRGFPAALTLALGEP